MMKINETIYCKAYATRDTRSYLISLDVTKIGKLVQSSLYLNGMKIVQPHLPARLRPIKSIRDMLESEGSINEVQTENDNISGYTSAGIELSESIFIKTDISHTLLDRSDISNCEFKSCDLSGSSFPNSSWRSTSVTAARCSGLQVHESSLKNISFVNSKLEIVNFRFSKLENILFEDCTLNDIDFYNANLKNVTFINCTINKINLASARLINTDLSESNIIQLDGIDNLKGVTISYDQLLQLAPYFAAEAGIKIR